MVSPEFGVQMSCGHLNTLVSVRCRTCIWDSLFIAEPREIRGQQGPVMSADVGF